MTAMRRFDEAPVTWSIVIAYVTVLVLTAGYDDDSSLFWPSGPAMAAFGASSGALLVDEPWRLLTSAFAHFGLLHFGMNTWFLSWIGPQLEREIGGLRFALLYVVAALGGSVAATLATPQGTVAGGSGAIFGMMGGTIGLLARRGRTNLDFLEHHGARNLLTLIGMNLVLGMMIPMISNAAHVGGLLAGFGLAYFGLARPRGGVDRLYRLTQAGLVALLAAATLYAVRPVLSLHWHLRQIASPATSEDLREEHASAIGADLLTARLVAWQWTEDFAELWGEAGEALARRWRD